jgi:hypothetical protein
MPWSLLIRYVIPVLTLICLVFLCVSFLDRVFALSPSFSREEIKDRPFDWRDIDRQEATLEGNPYTDIRRVNYFSDGKYLNATFWLRGSIINASDNGQQISYGTFIDGDSDTETGWQGVDYQTEISRQNGTWMSTIAEFSSLGDIRILENKKLNSTDLSKNMGNYIPLSLDLSRVIFPEKYKVIFYAGEIKKDNSNSSAVRIMDFTNWVHIPTPEFVIDSRPSTVELRPGEQKTFVVNVNSTTGFEPLVHLSAINLTGVEWKFQHNQLHLPSYGLQTIPLQIKVSENATARPYLLNLLANATFPSESLISSPSSEEEQQQFILPQENEKISKQAILAIDVLPPLTLEERVTNFWSIYGNPMVFVYGIAAGVAPWLFIVIKNRLKRGPK